MSDGKRGPRFFKPDVARDVDDELAAHLEMRRQELIAQGMDPEAAKPAAEQRFGDVNAVARECREIDMRWHRETRRTRMWHDLRQDIGYGLRLLGRAPGFTALAVLTLALGIGVTTAIFSVVDAALLRPLPYPDPEQLVELQVELPQSGGRVVTLSASIPDMAIWRQDPELFSHLAISHGGQPVVLDAA